MARKRKHPVTESLPLSLPKDFDSESALSSPDSQSSGKQEKHPLVRSAANARERSRMRVLSKAFSRLKTTLPWVPADTKLSKLDTLRLAACYIAHLRDILAEDKAEQHVKADVPVTTKPNSSTKASSPAPIHPLNLVRFIYHRDY